jgi:D-sedoheptulose 7-phosphate isomerase
LPALPSTSKTAPTPNLNAVEMMAAPIAAAIETMTASLINGGKILACGNGGSAGDAQHFAAELIGRFRG